MPVITENSIVELTPHIFLDGLSRSAVGNERIGYSFVSKNSIITTKYQNGSNTSYATIPGSDTTQLPFNGRSYRLNIQGGGGITTYPSNVPRVVTASGQAFAMYKADRVELDPAVINDIVGDSFSIAWRANIHSIGSNFVLLGEGTTGGNHILINHSIRADGSRAQILAYSANRTTRPSNGRMDRLRIRDNYIPLLTEPDQWVFTRNGTAGIVTLYRNGVIVDQKNTIRQMSPLQNLKFQGTVLDLHDFKIYGRELAIGDTAIPPEVDPDLRYWLDFEEGLNDPAFIDKSGNYPDLPVTGRYPNNIHIMDPFLPPYKTVIDTATYPIADISGEFNFSIVAGLDNPEIPQGIFKAYDGTRGFFISSLPDGNVRVVYVTNTPAGDVTVTSTTPILGIIANYISVNVKSTAIELVVNNVVYSSPITNFMDQTPAILEMEIGGGYTYNPASGGPTEVIEPAAGMCRIHATNFLRSYDNWEMSSRNNPSNVARVSDKYFIFRPKGSVVREPGQWGDINGTVFMVIETTIGATVNFTSQPADIYNGLGLVNGDLAFTLAGGGNYVSTQTYGGGLAVVAFSSQEGVNELGMSINNETLEIIPTSENIKLPIDVLGNFENTVEFTMREFRSFHGAVLSEEEFETTMQTIKSRWSIV